jgi:3-deoxy-D-manno-octulosonate 8-phosphate phosphatase (KDO 8-P phosphatase)
MNIYPKSLLEKAELIRLVIFDVDGVLTDGSLYLGNDGEELKAFYVRDGLGMKLLQATGVIIAIITAKISRIVVRRMEELGIHHVFQGQHNKLIAFKMLCEELQLEPQQVAYVGDDVIDVPVMLKVGLAIAVGDADALVVERAHWQTQSAGGRGAAREVCELIMQAQGSLTKQLSRFGIEELEKC